MRASKRPQQGKAFATKPDNLSSMSGLHMVERGNPYKSSSDLCIYMYPHIYTHIHMNNKCNEHLKLKT